MNDPVRNHKYVSALRDLVTSETTCLCLSDGSLLAPLAAKLGAKKVYCIDGNSLTQNLMKDYVKHNKLEDKVEIYGNTKDFLSTIKSQKVSQIFTMIFTKTSLVDSSTLC